MKINLEDFKKCKKIEPDSITGGGWWGRMWSGLNSECTKHCGGNSTEIVKDYRNGEVIANNDTIQN